MYKASISDTTDKIHNWSPEGDILTLITTYDEPMKVDLNKMRPAVDSLFDNLEGKVQPVVQEERSSSKRLGKISLKVPKDR